jgi:hypothetical protein
MNRKLPYKKLLSLIMLGFLLTTACSQEKCAEDSVLNIKGKWRKTGDANMPALKSIDQFVKRIDKISLLFLQAYPEPRGTQPEWYRNVDGDPVVPGGPTPYEFNSLLQYWYCNQNLNRLMVSGETGNWGMVFINSLKGFLWDQQDRLKLSVDNSSVYLLPNPAGEWKGHALYDFSDGSRSIILLRDNKKPWRSISRGQYLRALKSYWQNEKKKSAEGFEEAIADHKKTIREWQTKKDISEAFRTEIITSLEKDLDAWKNNQKPQMEKINKYWDDKIAVIDNYLDQFAAELQKPAILDRSLADNFEGTFSEIGRGGQMLVTPDESYFNKQLPGYIPQLMVLRWKWQNDVTGLYWKSCFEEKFQVVKLVGMLYQ